MVLWNVEKNHCERKQIRTFLQCFGESSIIRWFEVEYIEGEILWGENVGSIGVNMRHLKKDVANVKHTNKGTNFYSNEIAFCSYFVSNT